MGGLPLGLRGSTRRFSGGAMSRQPKSLPVGLAKQNPILHACFWPFSACREGQRSTQCSTAEGVTLSCNVNKPYTLAYTSYLGKPQRFGPHHRMRPAFDTELEVDPLGMSLHGM